MNTKPFFGKYETNFGTYEKFRPILQSSSKFFEFFQKPNSNPLSY